MSCGAPPTLSAPLWAERCPPPPGRLMVKVSVGMPAALGDAVAAHDARQRQRQRRIGWLLAGGPFLGARLRPPIRGMPGGATDPTRPADKRLYRTSDFC